MGQGLADHGRGQLRVRQGSHDARIVVASLRMEAAQDPDDPELAILVGPGPPNRTPARVQFGGPRSKPMPD